MALRFGFVTIALATMLTCATLFLASSARAQSAQDILQKTRDTYVGLKSYADTAVIVDEYVKDRHTFTTYFNRVPRRFYLDFHKQGGDRYVVWGDPDAFHTWWKTTGQQTDYPNPNNSTAITLSGPGTKDAIMKIPTLLYGKALGASLLAFRDPVLDGPEQIGGRRCYRISGRASDVYGATGNEVNVHKITVWIDADSFLVRQVQEEWPPLAGARHRITTTYEPQANPALDEARFKFTPDQK